ncbi:hypothetical protein EC957_011149 [Mortierella hygrophila]|uniref:Yeast cell wall synthesis Kre9/Knh1-like N-terminal domain-containing protein n=1 Tax=Mortierella hygrophila TaxID=979708 RepID=A0A9P6F8A4_9FUNG|nr:hypothetical protein EC957_011149 [Mortierella hygrophila]
MKSFITFAAAASLLLVTAVSADMLQINNPTDGTVWKTGVPNFVGWTGNCASMGNDSKTVKVDLVNGPSTAVRYIVTLGTLDCSGSDTRADMTVPSTVASGEYAIVVRTVPQQSYTNAFSIENPSQPASPAPGAAPSQPSAGAGTGTGTNPAGTTASGAAGALAPSVLLAAGGVAALAFQLL